MHIAFLTPEYPHDKISHSGGMGTSIKNLANALIKNGHRITIFVYGQPESLIFNHLDITFHLIAQKKYQLGGFYFYRKHIEKYVNNHSNGIDIIEAPDWTGITAFMNLRLPLVIRFHGSDTYFCHIENRKQKFKNNWFEKNAVNKAIAFIAPTHFAGVTSMRLFKQPNQKLKVIPYGLDLSHFSNENPERYNVFSILNIGTVIRKKGVFQLVKIFESLLLEFPDATLTFIGGDSNDVLTGASSTWGLIQQNTPETVLKRIHYLGKVPYSQVQENIKKAHVCVFPSLAETLGMVTIESMAMEKAVVNTDMGWAQDLMVNGIDGFMHHPDDIESYVHTISMLFKDQTKVEQIGKSAVKSVQEKFDMEQLVHRNIAYYNELLQ